MRRDAATLPVARAASRWTRGLAVALLLTLPFSAVDLGFPLGDMGGNLSLPVVAALLVLVLPAALPFPVRAVAGDPYERLVVSVVRFFLWCAAVTVATGLVFEFQGRCPWLL